MDESSEITAAEAEIDKSFASNPLAKLPYAQAMWTLLSAVEDIHLKNVAHTPLGPKQGAIFVDILLNSLTYPVRVCHRDAPADNADFPRVLNDEHYTWAMNWIKVSEDYTQFCSIFPLYHAGELELRLQGCQIIPVEQPGKDYRYEVYDRFVARRDPLKEPSFDATAIMQELRACMRVSGGVFSVDFSRRLMQRLDLAYGDSLQLRHNLPGDWSFTSFSLAQFRKIVTCLQGMAHAWFVARYLVASRGAPAMAFCSALWTPKRGLLVTLISRHTGLHKALVSSVLRYLTFGEVGIRSPDIALQPIVDLRNGQVAVSPAVLKHVNPERNLCALLNQIPSERTRYSALVHEKEDEIRRETLRALTGLGLDFRYGKLADTDIDLAIIDREDKTCLCVEIKWFIEPAEIREVLARSKEIARGVEQALKIKSAFAAGNGRLLDLLGIDQSYQFMTMVGSVNFIGRHGEQHPEVPVTKIWHLVSEIRRRGALRGALSWLRARDYLPKKEEFRIVRVPIRCGPWRSQWYGIAHADEQEADSGSAVLA